MNAEVARLNTEEEVDEVLNTERLETDIKFIPDKKKVSSRGITEETTT